MIKIYKMPNGKLYRYDEAKAPKEAVLFETDKKVEEKAEKPAEPKKKEAANKARTSANKAKKAEKK